MAHLDSILHLSMWCSYPNEDLCWLQVVDDAQGDSKDDKPVEWIASWKPNITINLVDDFTRYVLNECQLSIRFCMWYEIIEFRPHYLIHSAALNLKYLSYVHFQDLLPFPCLYSDTSLWFTYFLDLLFSFSFYLLSDYGFGTVISYLLIKGKRMIFEQCLRRLRRRCELVGFISSSSTSLSPLPRQGLALSHFFGLKLGFCLLAVARMDAHR
jgi:hypothetical protein